MRQIRKIRDYVAKSRPRNIPVYRIEECKCGAILGHSFIKNIKRYVHGEIRQRGKWQEVSSGEIWEPVITAEIMKLDDHYLSIDLQWAYTYACKEWKWAVQSIMAGSP